MHFDGAINLGQVVTIILFLVGGLRVWSTQRDALKWIKGIMVEFRPHDHGGHDDVLRRSDLRYPRSLQDENDNNMMKLT